jgi:ABC-type transport system involved in cytochrome bd biosynthesis fused ATPase/permease subunit
MATGGEGVGQGIRFLEVVKDLPLWLLTAVALALCLFLFASQLSADLENAYRPWLILATILFALLAVAKWVSVLMQWLRARRAAAETRRTLRVTAVAHQCIWSCSKQADDSFITQISADLMVKKSRPISARTDHGAHRGAIAG